MKLDAIETLITVFGILLLIFSMAIIFLGKKVGAGSGRPQMIKIGKWIEARTLPVIMLFIICALFTLTPLLLKYFRFSPSDYIKLDELNTNYIARKDLSFSISGQIRDETRAFAQDVAVTLEIEKETGVEIIKRTQSDWQGTFKFNLPPPIPKQGEIFIIRMSKPGYTVARQKVEIGVANVIVDFSRAGVDR